MIKDHLQNVFLKKFVHQPTVSQTNALGLIFDFLTEKPDDNKLLFLLKGYAGTGKTSLIGALVQMLAEFELPVLLMAPTGRAAKVFSSFAGQQAFTIHKVIFRQRAAKDGFGDFVLDANLNTDTLFIVDEASMISNESVDRSVFGSGCLLDDLIRYVYSGTRCKMILVGDSAQLPPVGSDLSPALNPLFLEGYGIKFYQAELSEVIRQSLESGILFNATRVREKIQKAEMKLPRFDLSRFDDIIRTDGSEFMDLLNESYDHQGIDQTIVVCRSNKRANMYNEGIRQRILFLDEEIVAGDLLMVVKNNYYWMFESNLEGFIANGDIVKIKKIYKYEEIYGFRFAKVTLELIDYDNLELDVNILLSSLWVESASLSTEQNRKLFYSILEDYQDLKPKRVQYQKVKENPYFNALQVKFAYAVTCHKAQGGQWKRVFIDPGYFEPGMLSVEYLRWLYTAITRASGKVYLVNFNKSFFGE